MEHRTCSVDGCPKESARHGAAGVLCIISGGDSMEISTIRGLASRNVLSLYVQLPDAAKHMKPKAIAINTI